MSGLATSAAPRIGPLSPSSPPLDTAKSADKAHPIQQTPQTPTSPPPMSVSNASTFASTQPSTAAPGSQSPSQPLSSPPSSAPMSAQVSQQAMPAQQHAFPTPANSTSGPLLAATAMDETENDATIQKEAEPQSQPDTAPLEATMSDAMDLDQPEHTRTDHDRQADAPGPSVVGENVAEQEAPGDQSMVDAEAGPSAVASKDDVITLEQLQKNMGQAFLLCRTPHDISRPHPSQHLLSLYGLSPLVSTVARTDPKTGEKINKLRKSYEGKIKEFGLAGKNKPVKHEDGKPGLRDLMYWPDEEWHNQKVYGKSIAVTPDMTSKLQSVMKMEPGPVPNNDMWEENLGHEKPRPIQAPEVAKKQGTAAPVQQRQQNGTSTAVASAAAPEVARPRRAGKKRSYNDSSFAGYGEGWEDEADLDFSNSEDGRRASGKKRKKEHATSTPVMERGSYGSGMYSIGAR